MEPEDETKTLVQFGMTPTQERRIREAMARARALYGIDEGTALERFARFWVEREGRIR